jgi:phosphoadenylyl-sulfate reductase (thioredoxin)
MALAAQTDSLERLETLPPGELLRWAYETHGDRAGIVTSFQDTGCVMIDIACTQGTPLRVLTVDTLRLHEETYALIDQVEARYGIAVERFTPDPDALRQMVQRHGEYLFFDSQPKQEYCCKVRKVEPNQRALATLDVWFTGLRRDQSEFRRNVPRVQRVRQGERHVLKAAPLIDWTGEDVWNYIREHDVPYNPLYDQSYTSIGCIICTTPTQPWEDRRAGRWRWFNEGTDHQKECGIHTSGSGI